MTAQERTVTEKAPSVSRIAGSQDTHQRTLKLHLWSPVNPRKVAAVIAIMSTAVITSPSLSHHSFAMYDQTMQKTVTGKLTRFVLGSNHAQLNFAFLNPDGREIIEGG